MDSCVKSLVWSLLLYAGGFPLGGLMESRTFGWHGVEFQAPLDWELAVDKGAFEKGFMRIDDTLSPRMGLNWESVKQDKAKPMSEMVKGIKDRMRKKDKNVRFLRETTTKVCGHPARFFHWRSTGEGYGIFWYCPKTNRIFAGEFYFATEEYEKMRPAVDNVFESLECHSDKKVQRWTVFGLDLHVPSEFRIKERTFYATRLHLVFESKQATFMLDRASFAQSLIGEKYKDLKEWYEKDYKKDLRKKYRRLKIGTPRRGETLGHRGYIVPASYKEGTILRKTYRVETRLWTCEPENKLFAVTTVRREDTNGKILRGFSTMMESVRCHGGAQEAEAPGEAGEPARPREAPAVRLPQETVER